MWQQLLYQGWTTVNLDQLGQSIEITHQFFQVFVEHLKIAEIRSTAKDR